MKHKVKLTVIDKKLYPELQKNSVLTQIQALVLVITLGMNLFLKEMTAKTIFGVWGLIL